MPLGRRAGRIPGPHRRRSATPIGPRRGLGPSGRRSELRELGITAGGGQVIATFTGTHGADRFVGADGEADTFRFTPATLAAAHTVMGGGGAVTDTLQCLGAGAIAVAQFDGVSGIQRIQHHAGGGADALIGGAVNDFLPGGPGADVIDLTVGLAGADPLQYQSPSDGTADINGAGALSQAMPASIFGFGAGDKLALFRPGPGLGSGGIVAVPADGAWKIGDGAVFPLESGSARSDALNSNNHASLTAIECAINTDNGAGFGPSAGRMVALVISNRETQAAPTTGLHLRTDTDGDSVPEAGDVARRPAVLQGVTANQMASGASIELI